jgi:hypothetical protein
MLNAIEEEKAEKITQKNRGKWVHIKTSFGKHLFMSSSLETKDTSSFILSVRKNGDWVITHEKGIVPKITKDLLIVAYECGEWIDTTLVKCLEEYKPNSF